MLLSEVTVFTCLITSVVAMWTIYPIEFDIWRRLVTVVLCFLTTLVLLSLVKILAMSVKLLIT